jgi:hypothetical protein
MLVLSREIHHLGDLGLGDLIGIDATDPNPAAVDM